MIKSGFPPRHLSEALPIGKTHQKKRTLKLEKDGPNKLRKLGFQIQFIEFIICLAFEKRNCAPSLLDGLWLVWMDAKAKLCCRRRIVEDRSEENGVLAERGGREGAEGGGAAGGH